eukprot:s218_g42.t1
MAVATAARAALERLGLGGPADRFAGEKACGGNGCESCLGKAWLGWACGQVCGRKGLRGTADTFAAGQTAGLNALKTLRRRLRAGLKGACGGLRTHLRAGKRQA